MLDNPPEFWQHYTWDKKQQLPSVQPKGRAKEMRGCGIHHLNEWLEGCSHRNRGGSKGLVHTKLKALQSILPHWSVIMAATAAVLRIIQISFFTGELDSPTS